MTLNPECVRALLIYLEVSLDYDCTITPDEIASGVPAYDLDEIRYTCLKLYEAKLISAHLSNYYDEPRPTVTIISDITYEGHEFLANIQKESMWAKIKGIASDIGVNSVRGLAQIALSIVTELIKAKISASD